MDRVIARALGDLYPAVKAVSVYLMGDGVISVSTHSCNYKHKALAYVASRLLRARGDH